MFLSEAMVMVVVWDVWIGCEADCFVKWCEVRVCVFEER